MHIRAAKAEDARIVQYLVRQAHKQNVNQGFYFPVYKITRKQFRHLIMLHRYYILMAKGMAVGTIAIKKRKRYREIGSLAVLPAYQKKGFGLKLLRFAETQLRKMGQTKAVLFTPRYHPALPSYYRKHGYRQRNFVNSKRKTWILFEKRLLKSTKLHSKGKHR